MYFFYWSHRQYDVLHWGKTLFTYCQKCFNNEKLAAIRSQHHERRHCSQFLIVETLLTVIQQCFTSKWRTSQCRWSKKRKKVPMIVKIGRRTPAPPRGGTSLSWPLTTTAPQKNEKKTFTTTSFTGILTQSTVRSTYPNYRPFYIFDTPFIENIHTLCITNSTRSSLMPPTAV